jgi:aryl-alcohol dehydrogenase-like predicted oxidoreductase
MFKSPILTFPSFSQLSPAVASKCGFEVFAPTRSVSNSPAHINSYIEGTIERLGFAPDLYYLHRIDPSTSPN